MKRDEAMQWIREVRGVISRELRNDPRRFVEFHRNLRSKYKRISEPVHPPDRHSATLHTGR
jgi:hypothetical protein